MRAAIALALAACGDAGVDGDGTVDVDAPPGCTAPPLDAPWLRPLVTRVAGELAAAPRATDTQRQAARTYLLNELAAIGWTGETFTYANGANVIGSVPATMGAGALVVVGAHFDTVAGSPGANDNASGVAVVLAVARYLVDVPCRAAPVALAWFDQEELGLFGSRAYARSLDPAAVRAVHTIDQVAWDSDGDRVFELERPTPALEQEWRAAAGVVGVPVTTVSTEGTDHEAFRDLGFAAMGLTEEFVGGDTSPFRHTASDTASTVDADYLVLAAQLTGLVVMREISP